MSELLPVGVTDLLFVQALKDPNELKRLVGAPGITEPAAVEAAAWCAEMHLQLALVAREQKVDLVLMGGNGAALRMASGEQRGSVDNDYLTAASSEAISRLMDALRQRLSGAADPLFVPALIDPGPAVKPLDMVAYRMPVPRLLAGGRAEAHTRIKLEFHFRADIPPSEPVEQVLAVTGQSVAATIPTLPHQIALKLVTLASEPIGLSRDDSVVRQTYDVDRLAMTLSRMEEWVILPDAVESVCGYERRADPTVAAMSDDAIWDGIELRLRSWRTCTAKGNQYWPIIDAVQARQFQSATRGSAGDWGARFNRLLVLIRLVRAREGFALWRAIRETEAHIPADLTGSALVARRRAITSAVGLGKRHDAPRTLYWEALADAASLHSAHKAIDAALVSA